MTNAPAQPGEPINVKPLGPDLTKTGIATLVQTDALKVVRLVVPAGKEIPSHQAPGEITVAEEIHHKGTKDTKKRGLER